MNPNYNNKKSEEINGQYIPLTDDESIDELIRLADCPDGIDKSADKRAE